MRIELTAPLPQQRFAGSFQGFIAEFVSRHHGQGTSLQAVQMVVEFFPKFRDEITFNGRRGIVLFHTARRTPWQFIHFHDASSTVCFWKRPQILIAEMWCVSCCSPIILSTISSCYSQPGLLSIRPLRAYPTQSFRMALASSQCLQTTGSHRYVISSSSVIPPHPVPLLTCLMTPTWRRSFITLT